MKKILSLLLLGSMSTLMGLTSEQLLLAAMKDNKEAASALISAITDSAKQAKFIKLYNNKYGKSKGGADYVAPSGGEFEFPADVITRADKVNYMATPKDEEFTTTAKKKLNGGGLTVTVKDMRANGTIDEKSAAAKFLSSIQN